MHFMVGQNRASGANRYADVMMSILWEIEQPNSFQEVYMTWGLRAPFSYKRTLKKHFSKKM